jgi:S1-C subfamily serine protease
MLKVTRICCGGALILASLMSGTAQADELGAQIRKLIDEIAPSLVRVEYVTKGLGMTTREMKNSVTGILVSEDGLVMAMDPVSGLLGIFGETEAPPKPKAVRVFALDGKEFAAEFVGRDEEVKVSFYRVTELEEFTVPPLAFSETVPELADQVVVVDILPESFSPQPVFALVRINSVLEKPSRSYTAADMSLSIYYGAPVAALDGSVIGVVGQETAGTEMANPEAWLSGLSNPRSLLSTFVPRIIPTATLIPLVQNPPTEAGTSKGWLGIRPQVLDQETAAYFGVQESGGVLVSKVFEDTPAEQAGLQPEDIITHIDGEPVDVHKEEHYSVFVRRIQRIKPGTLTKFTVRRGDKEMEIGVTIGEKPKQVAQAETVEFKALGLTVRELTFDTRELAKLPLETTGVVVNSVDAAGAAGIAELETGDIILEVDGAKVNGLEGFKEIVEGLKEEQKAETVFFVHRGGQTKFVNVKPDWEEEE